MILRTIAFVLLLLGAAFIGFSYYVSEPAVDGVRGSFDPEIADRDLAWTFARSDAGLILVSRHNGDSLDGVNLTTIFGEQITADLLKFLASFDESQLPDNAELESFPLVTLINPVDYAGTSSQQEPTSRNMRKKSIRMIPPFFFRS